MTREPCSVVTCPRPARARGLCFRHYDEYRLSPEFEPANPPWTGPYCTCPSPTWQPLRLWVAVQCGHCGKPPRP